MDIRNHLILPVFLLLFISVGISCESETTDKDDPESLQQEEELEEQIRQERDDTTMAPNPIFEAELKGTNEAREDTDANGVVTLTVQNDSAFMKGEFSGLSSDFTGAHLHKVLQSDRVRRLEPSVSDDKRSGSIEMAFELGQEEMDLIQGDSLYISIYTTKYDNSGELSGQFSARDTTRKIPDEEN